MKRSFVNLVVEQADGETPVRFEVKTLGIAMFCRRNADPATVAEQWAAGLPEQVIPLNLPSIPERLPAFCKCSRYLLTTDEEIEVQGNQTCGEVEVVALVNDQQILIGVGSDHCDRSVEPYFYYKPKQMCPRVLGPRVWRYADVEDHWDNLELTASMVVDGRETPFQQGTLSALVPLPELLADSGFARDGLALYCGTLAMSDYVFGEAFSMKLHDPVLDRTLQHTYSTCILNPMP